MHIILVKPVQGILSDKYFLPVLCFLNFNLLAMIGNLLATERLPRIPPNRLWIPVVLRLLFIPFFLFCNYSPDTR